MNESGANWSFRYLMNNTPWDLGEPAPELIRRLETDPGLGGRIGRVLVPGCGRGYVAVALAEAGWQVTAVDVATAIESDVAARLSSVGAQETGLSGSRVSSSI